MRTTPRIGSVAASSFVALWLLLSLCPTLHADERALRCLLVDGNDCWAAGDGGAVLKSADGGAAVFLLQRLF